MEDTYYCNICKSPWHPASGHYISATMRWCGPCTKSWVREVSGMQKRRWGGEKFYDHARVPPPAEYMNYTFVVDQSTPIEGKKHEYQHMALTASGVTIEEAYGKIADQVPIGRRVWYTITDEYWTDRKDGDNKP